MMAPETDPRVTVRRFHEGKAANGHATEDVAQSPSLETISAATFATRELRARPWLVKDMIPGCTVTLLAGDGGTGKSLLAQQLAVAVTSATDWIGMLPETGGVMYLSAEDDVDEVQRRLTDITAAAGISFEDLTDFHLVPLAGKDAVLALPDRRSEILTPTPLWNAVADKVRALRPSLVVVDNLADSFAGNENSRPQARQFIGMLRGLAIECDLAIVVISHPSLTGLSSGSGTSGSTAWSNSVRSRLYLERAKVDDGDEPDPDLRILKVLKANYSPVGTEVRVRWDQGRFRLDSGGISSFDRLAAESRAESIFLELLRSFRMQGRDVSPSVSSNYAPSVFAGLPEGKPVGRKAFVAAMNRLFQAGSIRLEKHGPPSKQRSRIVVTP